MKNKKEIKNLPVVVISAFGHSGLDWLHSLIDSHKEVLIMPQLSFFRTIDYLKRIKKIHLSDSLNSKKITNIISKELFKKRANKSANILNKFQSKLTFKKYINKFLVAENNLVIDKRLFLAIHYAFAKINKINLNKKKIIVTQEHMSWNDHQYKKYFNPKFVFIARDPRATISGSLRMFKRYKNIPINYQIDINLSAILSSQNFFQETDKKKILVLKNEKMHKNLKIEMKKLSRWLGIKFSSSLLKSTFLGKKWIGESGYLSKADLKKSYPKNYYLPANMEARWRGFLDKNTILIIETVFEKMMRTNKYKFDNKLNIMARLLGYLSLLFRFNEPKNFISYIYGLIKNIIRRNYIIFFIKQSREIFDIQ